MNTFIHLSSDQGRQIYGARQAGVRPCLIALLMGVHKSTISRELWRYEGLRGWRRKQSQALGEKRQQACTNGKRFLSSVWDTLEQLFRTDFTPELAACSVGLEGTFRISPETTYQHAYAINWAGGNLLRHLRSQKAPASVMEVAMNRAVA